MKMNFFVVSKLLNTTTNLLIVGYLIFCLNLHFIYFNETFKIEQIIIILLNFILIGLHHFLSIRIKLDTDLLNMIYLESKNQPIELLTQQLDKSLTSLKLMPIRKSGREWNDRFNGCFKLYKFQIIILCLQASILFISMILLKLQ